MPDPEPPPPALIATPSDLTALLHDLEKTPVVAVDTESNSLFAYWEQVCLVQFSTPERDYIVDPLALPELGALAPLFANPRQQKIFHAAEYDILILKRDYGFAFVNIQSPCVTYGRSEAQLKVMKTEQAAALVARLDRHLAVDLLRQMRPADAGGVLEKMKPETAAELLSAMASGEAGGSR